MATTHVPRPCSILLRNHYEEAQVAHEEYSSGWSAVCQGPMQACLAIEPAIILHAHADQFVHTHTHFP